METTEVDGTLQQRILTILATVIRQDDTTHGVASSKDLRCAAWKIRWSEPERQNVQNAERNELRYRSCFKYKSLLDEVERMFQEKPSNACCSLQARMPRIAKLGGTNTGKGLGRHTLVIPLVISIQWSINKIHLLDAELAYAEGFTVFICIHHAFLVEWYRTNDDLLKCLEDSERISCILFCNM